MSLITDIGSICTKLHRLCNRIQVQGLVVKIIVLQLKTQSIKLIKEFCIKVNTKELDGVSKYNLSTLYMLG